MLYLRLISWIIRSNRALKIINFCFLVISIKCSSVQYLISKGGYILQYSCKWKIRLIYLWSLFIIFGSSITKNYDINTKTFNGLKKNYASFYFMIISYLTMGLKNNYMKFNIKLMKLINFIYFASAIFVLIILTMWNLFSIWIGT